MAEAMLRFQFDEQKGVEALTYVASHWPAITAFYAAKVLFYAEKYHLNRYGRPIAADTFIAMPNGPVPTTLYDFIKGRLYQAGDPEAILAAFTVASDHHPTITALRPPNLDLLSPSDCECLDDGIAFCRDKRFSRLSQLTHQERSWIDAPVNGPMDYASMIDADNPAREALLEEAREFAAFGVF